jgi:hypothetical protein
MINKVKAFCWYLILLFYLFAVLKSDLISVCRGMKGPGEQHCANKRGFTVKPERGFNGAKM